MNSRQRTLAALRGQAHDRIPVAQHNFIFCIRHCGIKVRDYVRNPELAAKVLAQTAYDFGYDLIAIDFDTCTLVEAMGSELFFPEDEPARVKKFALQSLREADKLKVADPYKDGRMPLWLETCQRLRELVGDEKAILGRADQGPFGALFLLRNSEAFMMDLINEEPRYIYECLDKCLESGVRFARAMLESGADLTAIGDSAAGQSLISPRLYAQYAQPYERRYKEALGPERLLGLHICGKSDQIVEGMVQTGADLLELDHYNDLSETFDKVAGRTCIWGNLDTGADMVRGDYASVFAKSRALLEMARRKRARFILAPGCMVNANAKPECVQAMTDAAAEFGWWD